MKEHIFALEGPRNVRDLGGMVGKDNQPLPYGVFVRADGLHRLTPADKEHLIDYGVDMVIDLRSAQEVSRCPNAFAGDSRMRYENIPMLDGIQSNLATDEPPKFPESMPMLYKGLLDADSADIARVFSLLSQKESRCTVFHCTAGKDRTGIVAMLLLDLAGVAKADIVENYSSSAARIESLLDPSWSTLLPPFLLESKPEYISEAYDHLYQNYGNAKRYLLAAGVAEAEIENLLAKLWEPQ